MTSDGQHVTDHDHPHPHEHPHPHHDGHGHAHSAGPALAASTSVLAWESKSPTAEPTPLLFVDCFSGVAGDMLLGALLDAGLSLDVLQGQLATLDLHGYRLNVQTKQSYGITGTKLDVLVDEAIQPERRLRDIVGLLERSGLPDWVRATAEAVFRRLARAEAKIHGSTVEAVHFHEVGAIDSIVDIVGSLIGLHALGIHQVYASSLPLPGGTVRAAHGLLPAPAPATLEILAAVGAPTRPAPVLGELVTPTGAAILAELATFEQPLMRVRRVGYGYGTKSLPWPNAVRVWLGEAWAPAPPRIVSGSPAAPSHTDSPHHPTMGPLHPYGPTAPSSTNDDPCRARISAAQLSVAAAATSPPLTQDPRVTSARGEDDDALPAGMRRDEVVVIEANIDDMTPELLGYAMERIFEAGALDVSFVPMQMKKHRPGTLLTVIGRPQDTNALAAAILRETTTLGVRLRRSERLIADRRQDTVLTPFGSVRLKVKLLGGRATSAPEYDDCAALARKHAVPLADVYRAALVAAEQAAGQ